MLDYALASVSENGGVRFGSASDGDAVAANPETGAGGECCCGGVTECIDCVKETELPPGVCSIRGSTGDGPRAKRLRVAWKGTTNSKFYYVLDPGKIDTQVGETEGFIEFVREPGQVYRIVAFGGGASYKKTYWYGEVVTGSGSVNDWIDIPNQTGLDTLYGNLDDVSRLAWPGSIVTGELASWAIAYHDGDTGTSGNAFRCNRVSEWRSDIYKYSFSRTGVTNDCSGGKYNKTLRINDRTSAQNLVYEQTTMFSYAAVAVEPCNPRTCEEWKTLWLAGDPQADLNGDGYVDAIDLDEIVRRYCV